VKFKKFLTDIVKQLNRFLYVKPKKPVVIYSDIDKLKTRKKMADTLFSVLAGRTSVLRAVSDFPKNIPDDSVNVCFHILMHLEADEDIRKEDNIYREEQDEFILQVASFLQAGEDIPINIINEYNDFYKETLIYPEINRHTVISRLKKFINI